MWRPAAAHASVFVLAINAARTTTAMANGVVFSAYNAAFVAVVAEAFEGGSKECVEVGGQAKKLLQVSRISRCFLVVDNTVDSA